MINEGFSRRHFLAGAALPAFQRQTRPARYALAAVSGTAVPQTVSQVRGVFLSAQTLSLKPDDSGSVLALRWKNVKAESLGLKARLRLALAADLRTFQSFEATLPGGQVVGSFDLSLGSPFEILELILPPEHLAEVLKSGIEIRARGAGTAISVFAPGAETPVEFCPALLQSGTLSPRQEFYLRFASRASLTPYGWQEGCVLDGLAALADKARNASPYAAALDDHLRLLFGPDVPPRKMDSIEGTPCVAQLARKNPQHPEVQATLDFWKSREDASGTINDGKSTVAEGNYTVAWPLAVLARELKRPDLAEKAAVELRTRRDRLVDSDGAIWLRYRAGMDPLRTYRLWSRGTAWYLLGLARTLDALPVAPPDLIAELRRAAVYLIPLQRADGMWRMFSAEQETAPESSGTAGIAAAFAIGVRRGWLGKQELASARLALSGLDARLTPDGFLYGTAPSNKGEGGERFQRASKGAILQWGMGMFGQLLAELDPPGAAG